MITTGIRELKNRLSHYLASVKRGEDVLITNRGKIVARIIPETQDTRSWRQAIQPLVTKGLVDLPTQAISRTFPEPLEVPGKPVTEIAIEARR